MIAPGAYHFHTRLFLDSVPIAEDIAWPLSVAALRKGWSNTPWQFMQYVFKINHYFSMQKIFCINCAAAR